MSRAFKVAISVLAGAFITLAAICAYGFIIGGEKNIAYLVFSGLCSSLISFGIIALIMGVDYAKSEEHRAIFVIISVAIAAIMMFVYNPINGFTKKNNYVEYEAEITKVSQYKGEPSRIYFKNQQGKEKMIWDLYGGITFDDERSLDEGKIIVIREYEGGFGFPYYDWADIH